MIMDDIYYNANSAVEATEIARSINDDRTGLERLNHLLRKQIVFGKDLSDVDDELKSEIRDKLINDTKEEMSKSMEGYTNDND